MQYVTVTNRKNLWKEAFKKYSSSKVLNISLNFLFQHIFLLYVYVTLLCYFSDGFFFKEQNFSPNICLLPYNSVVKDVLIRFYNCQIVNLRERSQKVCPSSDDESHPNILCANIVFETDKYFYLVQV